MNGILLTKQRERKEYVWRAYYEMELFVLSQRSNVVLVKKAPMRQGHIDLR